MQIKSLLFLFILNILLVNASKSTGIQNDEESLSQNSSSIFDEEKLNELKADDDYNYELKIEESGWWNEFKEWLWIQFQKLFGKDVDPGSWIFKLIGLLPYIVPALALIVIVWYIIKTNPGGQIMRQHNKSKVILTEEEELLMESDLDDLAKTAIENKELRLAVRYLYLSCLKRLDMKRIIRYTNEKTNYEYVKEIQFNEVSKHFKSLTLSYEQIWYGQMVFDKVYFNKYKSSYDEFHQLLDQKQYAKA